MCVKNTWVLHNTPCLIVYTFNGIKKAISVYFVRVAPEIEWCRKTETLIFGIQGNDLTDQIERKGRNDSTYGIPQGAFCEGSFSIETLSYRNVASHADSWAGTRDEPLRTAAWEVNRSGS